MRLALLTMMVLTMACGSSEEVADVAPAQSVRAPLRVYTVSYPLAYFAERIGGEAAEVSFPAPAGSGPENWSRDATTIAA